MKERFLPLMLTRFVITAASLAWFVLRQMPFCEAK